MALHVKILFYVARLAASSAIDAQTCAKTTVSSKTHFKCIPTFQAQISRLKWRPGPAPGQGQVQGRDPVQDLDPPGANIKVPKEVEQAVEKEWTKAPSTKDQSLPCIKVRKCLHLKIWTRPMVH